PADEDPPARAPIANAGTDALRAPALVGRAVGQVGPVPLPGVDDCEAPGTDGLQDGSGRLESGAGEPQLVAHRVDVASLPAEVRLPVDAQDRRAGRVEDSVGGPGIGISFDRTGEVARGLGHGVSFGLA